MLDENLPTFFTKPSSSENPLVNVVYFTQNGSEPTPEYTFKRPNPRLPESKNKFAVGLGDVYSQDVIFAEVLIEPEWQQPTLSAAEIRAQNGVPPPPVPLIPDAFTIQLYNPDQQVIVKGEKSTWTGKESWEFELPQQSFRMPSASKLDRQQSDPVALELTPKVCFKWKRDSKFSKDMTCYLTGTSLAGKKNKDPDITIALYKQGREPGLTIYEPNLRRVEVEDRKGLEVVLLLGAETIREIFLFPSRDSFNILGAPPPAKRKNSRPIPCTSSPKPFLSSSQTHIMSGGLGNVPPAASLPAPARRQTDEIDAETKRLQAMVEREEREREKRDKAEQERIKKMLEEEAKERRRRDAEIAQETERLRRQYGIQGQDIDAQKPQLPPRQSQPPAQQLHPNAGSGPAQPPPRPMSAEPPPSSMHAGLSNWWHGHVGGGSGASPPLPQIPGPWRRRGGSDADSNRIQKKQSVFF